jgi:hypothetical protein
MQMNAELGVFYISSGGLVSPVNSATRHAAVKIESNSVTEFDFEAALMFIL